MSTYDVVVVSVGAGGRWAARAAAAAGRRVLHVRARGPGGEAPTEVGPDDVPTDSGLLSAPGRLADAVFGPLSPVEVERAVLVRGNVHLLPLLRWELLRILPPTDQPRALSAWARARAAKELAQLIGGGSEQRSYRQWVTSRFGEPAYQALYAPYAEKRFGPPDEVLCGIARVVHALPGAFVAPAMGWGALPAAGHEEVVATVTRIAGGRVETDAGLFTGRVLVDAPPPLVATWLGDAATDALRQDASRLTARAGVEIVLRGGAKLPLETHVVDAAIPAFRLVRTARLPRGADHLVAHLAGDGLAAASDAELVRMVADPLRAIEPDVDGTGARVRRLPHHHPLWRPGHFTRLRSWALALEEREILPVGRLGLVAPLDPGLEVALVADLLGDEEVGIREAVRRHVEPPVLDPSERAHLTSFVLR